MLGGHLDDMEKDWSKPIVSMRYHTTTFILFFFKSYFFLSCLKHILNILTCKKCSSLISLGCKAIFLLGGKSREHTPIAMFLRSGDVVLMAGEARECFHGNISSYASSVPFNYMLVNPFLSI